MRKRRTPSKNKLKNKKLVAIPIISVVVIVLVSVVSFTLFQAPNKFSLKAAIIDQLGGQFPNATFIETATNILTNAGFNTTYYESQTVNVTFYQELAKQDYGIIILRAHSALRYPNNDTVDLFTSEEFNNQSYRQMWNEGYLSEGEYLFEQTSNTTYFAVTPEFIENIEGNFPRSIVIAMGCWSLKIDADQMAQAFLDKGAEAYIGWTNIILPKDTDAATTTLLETFVNQGLPLAQAVSQTKTYTYQAEGGVTAQTMMTFHPYDKANLTLSKLVANARNSASKTFLGNLQGIISLIAKPIPRPRHVINGTTQKTAQAIDNAERPLQKADSATAPLSNHACATPRFLQQAYCLPRLQ